MATARLSGINDEYLRRMVDLNVFNNCMKLLVLILQAFNLMRNTNNQTGHKSSLTTKNCRDFIRTLKS